MDISIVKGDLTRLKVDAIVNAANSSLLGGGGVDGAIHRAAGPGLLRECRRVRKDYPAGLPTGKAVITMAYRLPCRYVIHTVGPIYGRDDISLLRDCYLNSLRLADGHNCSSIAFPSISTGAYGVPIKSAIPIVKKALLGYEPGSIREVFLVLHSREDYDAYRKAFGR